MKLYFYQTKNRCFCKKNGFKQHCFKQPCLICFFLLSLQRICCTRQFESQLSLRSFAISLQKKVCPETEMKSDIGYI